MLSISSMITLSEETRRMQDMMKMYNMYGMDRVHVRRQRSGAGIKRRTIKLVQYVLEPRRGREYREDLRTALRSGTVLSHGSLSTGAHDEVYRTVE